MRSWGLELEFGDVRRDLIIPKELGFWNYNECDIVNQTPPYWGIAVDPLGVDPPVGGEINTIPTYDYRQQIIIFQKLKQFFIDHGSEPTSSCVSNTHVHIHIPNLKDNLYLLKKIFGRVFHCQNNFIKNIYGYGPVQYTRNDSGRKYTISSAIEILKSNTIDEFFMKCTNNPDKISDRYLVNFMSLLKNETLEFRFFRCTTETKHIESILKFCNSFVDYFLFDSEFHYNYEFPKLNWNEDLFNSWLKTRKIYTPVYKKNLLTPI